MEIYKSLEEGHEHANHFCKVLELEEIMYRYHLRHKEIHGCDESDEIYSRFDYLFDKPIINCRHLVFRERKGFRKRTIMVVVPSNMGRVDVNGLREILGTKKLEFASDEFLFESLHTYSGNVSIFHLCYDYDKQIEVVFDEQLLNPDSYLSFHPLFNGDSVFLPYASVETFCQKLDYKYSVLYVPRAEEKEMVLSRAM